MKSLLQPLVKSISAATLGVAMLLGAGCASIVHNGARTITVSSVPAGAKSTISLSDTGHVISVNTTPFVIALEPKARYFKGQGYSIKFELPGYQTAVVELHPRISGWYWGNILFGGLIGMIVVDPLTGDMWNISPDHITQQLTAGQASMLKSGNGFMVVLASQVTAQEKANLVRIQ